MNAGTEDKKGEAVKPWMQKHVEFLIQPWCYNKLSDCIIVSVYIFSGLFQCFVFLFLTFFFFLFSSFIFIFFDYVFYIFLLSSFLHSCSLHVFISLLYVFYVKFFFFYVCFSWRMLAIIRCEILYLSVCYKKMQRLRYTEL